MVQQQWWRFSSEGITELRASYVAIAAPGCSRSMYVEEALQYVLLCSAGRGGGEGERVIVTGGQLLTRSDAEDKSYLL